MIGVYLTLFTICIIGIIVRISKRMNSNGEKEEGIGPLLDFIFFFGAIILWYLIVGEE